MNAEMLKLTTWNVNGIRARERDVLALIERERPDVLCLQEVKASIEQVPPALCELPGYHCYWHGHKGYSGVGLHLSQAAFPVRPEFAHPEFDHETRIVSARAGDLLCASIYVPNGGKDFDAKVRFLDGLDAYARDARAAGLRVMLCGDLNVAREERDVHPSLRKPGLIGCTPQERAQLERVIAHDLVDLSRKFHPDDDRLFTWWAPWRNLRQKNVGWRIDYVLCSTALAERATRCSVDREFGGSDHAPLTAEFDVEPPRAPASGGSEPAPRAGQLRLF
jgi:exodeoxyribonuclease-3